MQTANKEFQVVFTVSDPASGGVLVTHKLPCLSAFHARAVLGNVSDLVAELAEYWPGLAVAAYEIEEVVSVTPAGVAALAEAVPAARRDVAFWAKAAGQ